MIVIAAFVVICVGVRAAQATLTPVLLGAYLAIVATPLVRWLQKHRFPLVVAASIALLADTVVLVGFLGLLVVSTSELCNHAPNYVGLFQERAGSLAEWLGDLAVLFGMLAFLLNYIPNVDSRLAAVPAIALGYLSGGAGSLQSRRQITHAAPDAARTRAPCKRTPPTRSVREHATETSRHEWLLPGRAGVAVPPLQYPEDAHAGRRGSYRVCPDNEHPGGRALHLEQSSTVRTGAMSATILGGASRR